MSFVKAAVAGLLTMSAATSFAAEGPIPGGIPHLDHVFVIMMENHSFGQVLGNAAMPFVNGQISNRQVNLARNYYAVGHPSLTNYLEVVGGSNFGVRSDNSPDWHNGSCRTNLQTGIPNADDDLGTPPYPIDTNAVCPISGVGTDAETEAVDDWNEIAPPVFNHLANIDGRISVPAARNTVGKTIADQLALWGGSWKSYQESLPVGGADLIDNSNGTATNLTTYDATHPLSATNLPPLTSAGLLAAYAVKHNPFAYFQSVQEGSIRGSSLRNIVAFDGAGGLYADLSSGHVPTLSFIAPNQCDDQHGRGNGDAFCQFDQGTTALQGLTDGTLVGLNPGLSEQADTTVNRIVTAITASPAWRNGYNAIVVVWDENDYSGLANPLPANTLYPAANRNNVVMTVQTNSRFEGGVQSGNFYNSFSLLKSLEAGLHLPCLNHACDADVKTMSDLFGPGR
ncbi:MAG TPA: alkaline phosphatase family protein [Steroidobacteraceae bacterium]|nr:alkaline phosphatase family protein [Steroidobacteraceae bacterium]